MKISRVAIFVLACSTFATAMRRDVSSVPPGDVPVKDAPQFVSIGFDDNYFPRGMKWFLDFMRDKRNHSAPQPNNATFDGAPARVSFFVNTNNAVDINTADPAKKRFADSLVAVFNEALADGHEIGNHTETHNTWSDSGSACWQKEITGCCNALAKRGISKDTVVGFRTPYLRYNSSSFAVVDSLKFLYDCSIETGWARSEKGATFCWPYTLDKGVPAADVIKGATVGRHPGLWELPVYCVIVPPPLRHRLWARTRKTEFDTASGKITGMDYNMWIKGQMEIQPEEFLAILKYTLDQRLAGNRAPLCFCAHTPLYDSLQFYGPLASDTLPAFTNVPAMRKAMEDFVVYALSKPQVRIVPFREIVHWCENPSPLKQ
jgi:hypothetical protein